METFINEIEKAFATSVTTADISWDKHSKVLSFKVNGYDVICVLGFPYEAEWTRRIDFVCNTYIKTPEMKVKERQSQNHADTTKALSKKVINYLAKYNK